MILGTLSAGFLGNMLAGKEMIKSVSSRVSLPNALKDGPYFCM